MRNFISPDTVAGELMMRRASYPGSFLLVEGSSDARLMKRLVSQKSCAIKDCVNRDFTFKVVALLDSRGFVGHLAVIDEDFGRLLQQTASSLNVVTTDM